MEPAGRGIEAQEAVYASEIVVCTQSDANGSAIIVYYWPDYWSTLDAPSACCRWFWSW